MANREELIGVVVSTTAGMRIQLLDDPDYNRFVVRYQDSHQVNSEEKTLSYKEPGTKDSALVAALDEFVVRIRAEREGLQKFLPIDEFALILSPSDKLEMPDYAVYFGAGDGPEASIAAAEELAISMGMFDIDALRNDPDYSSAIARLIQGAQDVTHTGIALLIR